VLRHRHYLIEHPEDGLDSRSFGHFAELLRRENPDSPQKTRNNSTGTGHELKTGKIGQQSNNNQPTKEPTFPRTRKRKNDISMKRKTQQHLAQKKNGTVFPSPPRHGAIMKTKNQANAWAGRVIFPLSFFCVSLSLFPRTTTKNIKNSVDRR